MKYATFSIPPKIVHGVGALEFLSTLEGKKAAIVTGGSSMKKFGFIDEAKGYGSSGYRRRRTRSFR